MKKILALVLSIILLMIFAIPSFPQLKREVEAKKSAPIVEKLDKDLNLVVPEYFDTGEEFILDLNGHNITESFGKDFPAMLIVRNKTKLTIIDSKDNMAGSVFSSGDKIESLIELENGELHIQAGKFECKKKSVVGIKSTRDEFDTKFTLDGGTLISKQNNAVVNSITEGNIFINIKGGAITGNFDGMNLINGTAGIVKLQVEGGKISGNDGNGRKGIFIDKGVKAEINGGDIIGAIGVESSSGQLIINGGNIKGAALYGVGIKNGDLIVKGGNITGSWEGVFAREDNKININGGSFIGENSDGMYLKNKSEALIKKGSFKGRNNGLNLSSDSKATIEEGNFTGIEKSGLFSENVENVEIVSGEFETKGSGEFSSSLCTRTDAAHSKKVTEMIKKGSTMTPDENPIFLNKNPDYYSLIKRNVAVSVGSPTPLPGPSIPPGPEPSPTEKTLSAIQLSPKAYTYDGQEKMPEAMVYAGSTVLKKDTDYSLSYQEGRKEVGEYKVEAKGTGVYSGTVSAFFKISPKGTKITKIKRGYGKYFVKWKKQLEQTDGYQLKYSRSKTFKKSNMKTVKGSNTTAMRIKLPKEGKKYYVKVRTYKTVEGKKICSKWFKAR